MMLIILDRHPLIAVRKLYELTPIKFCFKQLIELAQLICSAGYSDVYKKVPQGKEIQEWIKKNPMWTCIYMNSLLSACTSRIKIKDETNIDLLKICVQLSRGSILRIPDTAIWRYKKGYISTYLTNSELPIDEVIELYTEYITKFKFPKKKTDLYK